MSSASDPKPIGGKILVVEDDESFRRSLNLLLEGYDYSVLEASSGTEALTILDQAGVDLIILDLILPGINGVEVCRRIRQDSRFKQIPIVFVTAFDDRDFRVAGKQAGGDDFMIKPIDEIELTARISYLLESRRHVQRIERDRVSLRRTVEEQSHLIGKAMAEIGKAQQTLRRFNEEIVFRLSKAVEFRDDETGNHVQRMSRYCGLIATLLGMTEEMSDAIRIASALHDVGKIAIPDEILHKPASLSEEEMAIMRRHAEKGYRMLAGSESSMLELAAIIARTHHEKFDGTGYPRRLKGKEIPIEGRIASVADIFDALTSPRVYKKAFTFEKAKRILMEGAGTIVDQQIVEVFFEAESDIRTIMIVYSDR